MRWILAVSLGAALVVSCKSIQTERLTPERSLIEVIPELPPSEPAPLPSLLPTARPTWNQFLGSHYRDRSWDGAIREAAGPSSGGFEATDALVSVVDATGKTTTKDLNDFFTTHLPAFASALPNNLLVIQFGGLGSAKDSENGYQNVANFMNLVKSDVSIYRNAMYQRAKAIAQLGHVDNVYWQIGNEISATSYSKNLHLWAGDGLPTKDSDLTIIPMFVEYFLAPGVEGVEQASQEVLGAPGKIHLMLGSIVNVGATSKQTFLDAILDYTIAGTYAPSLAGKKVAEVIDSLSIHYTSGGSFAWRTYLDNLVATRMKPEARLKNLFSTEEIGGSSASSGNAMGSIAKILSRYLSWWEDKGWDHHRGHLFLYAPDSNGLDSAGLEVPLTSAGHFLEQLNLLVGNQSLSKDTRAPALQSASGALEWYSFRSDRGQLVASVFAEDAGQATPASFQFSWDGSQPPQATLLHLTTNRLTQSSIAVNALGNGRYSVDLSSYPLTGFDGVVVVVGSAGSGS